MSAKSTTRRRDPLATRQATRPEGPYESEGQTTAGGYPVRDEQIRFVDFVARLYEDAEALLQLSSGQREMRMLLHLIACHFDGAPVTSSSLAAASGLSYGTAQRTIDGLTKRGMIVRRNKTASGRTQTLHPSNALLVRWRQFAFRGEASMQSTINRNDRRRRRPLDASGTVLPPPAVLQTKLSLGRALRVLVHADPTFMAMRNLKRQFEMILGASINSRAHSIDRLRAEIVSNSKLPVSKYDIVAVDLPWFGEMASANRLLPLGPLIAESEFDQSDIYPDALASSSWQGMQYGVPIMTSGELLVYREDLLAEKGLHPPKTIEQTLAAARALHSREDNIAGIAWNGGRGTPVGHTFLMVMSAFGQPVINLNRTADGFDAERVEADNLRPMFLSPAAWQTAEYLKELLDVSPPEILNMNWYDRARAYAEGRAAMAYSHSLLAPIYELDPSSPAHCKTGYASHPTGPLGRPIVPMGGYSLAIPANIDPARIADVWLALQTMTSASAAKLYLTNGSLSSPRVSVSRDPEVSALSPMVSAVDRLAAQGFLRAWPRPAVPGISEVIAVAGEEIHDILRGDKAIGQGLEAAQNRVIALTQARGFTGRQRLSG
ncbi:MAG: extracellular solute-binding protein [Paracoccaceae bacterium]